MFWFADYNVDTLQINRLRADRPEQLKSLLSQAVEYAASEGLSKICCWNVPTQLLDGTTFENVKRTQEHLPAVAWYGDAPPAAWKQVEHYTYALFSIIRDCIADEPGQMVLMQMSERVGDSGSRKADLAKKSTRNR